MYYFLIYIMIFLIFQDRGGGGGHLHCSTLAQDFLYLMPTNIQIFSEQQLQMVLTMTVAVFPLFFLIFLCYQWLIYLKLRILLLLYRRPSFFNRSLTRKQSYCIVICDPVFMEAMYSLNASRCRMDFL